MRSTNKQAGFSLIELMITMVIMLLLMGVVADLLSKSLSVRARESQKADALTSATAALNVLSREISNSGFGIYVGTDTRFASNGIIIADSNTERIHIRANIDNVGLETVPAGSTVLSTNVPGEDVTYFFDATNDSIVRYDPNDSPQTSVVVNRISSVRFSYFDYVGASSTGTESTVPSMNTGRVRINVTVQLDPVYGQPNPSNVSFTSEVTLRNSNYMLNQY